MKRTFGVVLALGLAAAPAAADSTLTLGFDIGKPYPTGDLEDDFDGDFAYGGYATFGLVGALAVRGEIGRSEFSLNSRAQDLCDFGEFDCEGDLRMTNFSGGLQYGGFGGSGALGLHRGRVLPYVFFEVGAYKLSGELSSGDDETNFGFAPGGGINIRLGNSWGLQGDIHYHNVRFEDGDDEDWERWLVPQGGLWVSF